MTTISFYIRVPGITFKITNGKCTCRHRQKHHNLNDCSYETLPILAGYVEGLYHRSVVRRINLVAGINFVNYRFNYTSFVDSLPSYSVNDQAIGVTVGGAYLFNPVISLALFYRPAIISLHEQQYRHLIGLDVRFDLPLWKGD